MISKGKEFSVFGKGVGEEIVLIKSFSNWWI
jgi:hypothetical protein